MISGEPPIAYPHEEERCNDSSSRRKSSPRRIGEYYFWKWADNDLSGTPRDVYAALLRGEMHPALQPFDATPLLKLLSKAASKGRRRGEEWEWTVHPDASLKGAAFVFVTCPEIAKYDGEKWTLIKQLFALGLSGFDENHHGLIEFLLPKLNGLELGQYPNEEYADITAKDLPALLRKIRPNEPNATATLVDQHNNFVQCAAFERRFTVEWRENHDIRDLRKFDQWRVEYPPDVETRARRRIRRKFIPTGTGNARWIDGAWHDEEAAEKQHELICLSDVVQIFQAFLDGNGLPSAYCWRNINNELNG